MKATSPGPPLLLSRAGACRSAQRRTPTRRLPLPVLLTADAIPSALRIGEARQISVPIIILAFLCRPADSAIASDARKDHTRVSTGVPTRVRQAVFRPWPHLAGPNETGNSRVTPPMPNSHWLRCFFEEQRHEVRRPVRRPIRFLVDVGNNHQAARYVLSGRIGHGALDERIGAAELAHERRDRDLLISTGWP